MGTRRDTWAGQRPSLARYTRCPVAAGSGRQPATGQLYTLLWAGQNMSRIDQTTLASRHVQNRPGWASLPSLIGQEASLKHTTSCTHPCPTLIASQATLPALTGQEASLKHRTSARSRRGTNGATACLSTCSGLKGCRTEWVGEMRCGAVPNPARGRVHGDGCQRQSAAWVAESKHRCMQQLLHGSESDIVMITVLLIWENADLTAGQVQSMPGRHECP